MMTGVVLGDMIRWSKVVVNLFVKRLKKKKRYAFERLISLLIKKKHRITRREGVTINANKRIGASILKLVRKASTAFEKKEKWKPSPSKETKKAPLKRKAAEPTQKRARKAPTNKQEGKKATSPSADQPSPTHEVVSP